MNSTLLIALLSQAYAGAPQFSAKSWSHSDTKFKEIRRSYEAMNSSAWKREAKKIQSELASSKKPTHDLLFRWLTISYAGTLDGTVDRKVTITESSSFRKGLDAIESNPLPNSFEFTRAAFIQLVRYDFPHPSYIQVGRRLLKVSPQDSRLLAAQLRLFQPQAWPEHRKEGQRICDDLLRIAKVNEPEWRFRIGYFYYLCWSRSKSAADRTMANKYFDAYLSCPITVRAKTSVNNIKRRMSN